MDLKKFIVFDAECDGLEPTKIHVISWAYLKDGKAVVRSTTNHDKMRKLFSNKNYIYVAHNNKLFDVPLVLEKLLGVKPNGFVVDTLWLSWYLQPTRSKHGLGSYGEDYGIPKPVIEDWEGLSVEEYINRCEEDVKINLRLWISQMRQLKSLYGTEEKVVRFLKYLMFKADCAAEQSRSRWKLDVEKCMSNLELFAGRKEEKIVQLIEAMPMVPVIRTRKYPRIMYKKDGELSVAGKAWMEMIMKKGFDVEYKEAIEYVHSHNDPNPNSVSQVKEWLFSQGWKPETFSYVKDDDGTRAVPQVRKDKRICKSIQKLYKKEPKLELLEGLTVLSHRIGILKGFLSNASPDGWIKAEIGGLTNTLRFKHRVAVNLPGYTGKGDAADGEYIRGCLIAPEGYELCGSDMSSLEDRTKQHFMWDYDPEYVKEMMVPKFDPHMSLAMFAKALDQGEVDFFHETKKRKKADEEVSKEDLKKFEKISSTRHEYKTANYACVYGTGAETLSRSLSISRKKARGIIEAYWKRNWAVKRVSENCKIKTIGEQMWLFNPISKFWYSLRYDKDRFSVLNQGSGVFCFDTWVKNVARDGVWPIAQFHDEVVLSIPKGRRVGCENFLRVAIDKTNKELKLNREMDIDVQFGDNYAQIH